jgi:hypothetical protein
LLIQVQLVRYLPEPGSPLIYGSVAAMLLAVAIATPLSIAAALFLTEVAPNWARQLVQPALELFTGIPSVLYGFVGLTVLVPWVGSLLRGVQKSFSPTPDFLLGTGQGMLVAGFVLAIMILPTITTTSVTLEDHAEEASGTSEASKVWRMRSQTSSVIVTHNMQQAGRVSDQTGFFLLGDLVEFGPTATIFSQPRDKRTEDYITGRFG